jgi:hypothetical protein
MAGWPAAGGGFGGYGGSGGKSGRVYASRDRLGDQRPRPFPELPHDIPSFWVPLQAYLHRHSTTCVNCIDSLAGSARASAAFRLLDQSHPALFYYSRLFPSNASSPTITDTTKPAFRVRQRFSLESPRSPIVPRVLLRRRYTQHNDDSEATRLYRRQRRRLDLSGLANPTEPRFVEQDLYILIYRFYNTPNTYWLPDIDECRRPTGLLQRIRSSGR